MEFEAKEILTLRVFGLLLTLLSIIILFTINLKSIFAPIIVFGLIILIVSYFVYLQKLKRRK